MKQEKYQSNKRLVARRGTAVLITFVIAATGTACSTTGASGSGPALGTQAPESADARLVADAKAAVERGYKGDFQPPPSEGPKAVPGKDVWYISCNQQSSACVAQGKAFDEAGKELGWNVSIHDGKSDPTIASTKIRQAIAAGVDGIAISYYDCPGIKTALLDARAADVPVVAAGSIDCDSPAYGGTDKPGFAATLNLRGTTDAAEFYKMWGAARATHIIATTNGHANVLDYFERSEKIQAAQGAGFATEMKKCKGCTLNQQAFTWPQVPNPAVQQWRSALLSRPEVDTVSSSIDGIMALGLDSVIRESGRTDLLIAGGEGLTPNLGLIREGRQTSATALSYGWIYWGLADTLNRLLAGEPRESLPSQGMGWQYVDQDHNLPESGAAFEPSYDFRSAYRNVWNGTNAQ
ncbi:sugar ABC transporter substrate-binding protein [Spongiactinospora sp. 9N601]|uniref:sugar ABC transporter substrate-binding protein n=1 Tax=Spongiactinospora sp. 9N601 TaxID=3375149 RepID=UPI0037ABABBB